MIALLLFLILVSLIGVNVQLRQLLAQDFSGEDKIVNKASKQVSEAKKRIPKS